MAKVKSALRALGHALGVVAHDKAVEDAAKHAAFVAVVRGLVALGASAGLVEAVKGVLAHFGVA